VGKGFAVCKGSVFRQVKSERGRDKRKGTGAVAPTFKGDSHETGKGKAKLWRAAADERKRTRGDDYAEEKKRI